MERYMQAIAGKIGLKSLLVVILILALADIASAGQEFYGQVITLSGPNCEIRDLAFDNHGRIYALGSSEIWVYADSGKKLQTIKYTKFDEDFGALEQLQVSADGDKLYIRARKWYILDTRGKLIKKGDMDPSDRIARRKDGTFAEEYVFAIYSDMLDYLDIDYKDVTWRYTPDVPQYMFFTNEAYKEVGPYPGIPDHHDFPPPAYPKMRRTMVEDGTAYEWYDPTGLGWDSLYKWREHDCIRVIFRFSPKDKPEPINYTGLQEAAAYFNKKVYKGDTEDYDIGDIIAVSKVADKITFGMQRDFVRVLRNEIYARHGRVFKSPDLNWIFDACPWYKPDPEYSDQMLNSTEKKNHGFLVDYEEKMGWR